MKTFEKENYYTILDVTPNAGSDEIRHAYREALSVYDQESVATYALFSDAERETLLQAIETAYATLIDDDRRSAYNQMLIDTGQINAASFSSRSRRQLAARSDAGSTTTEASLGRWVAGRSEEPQVKALIETILAKERLSGPDLQQLREAYGIELSEIFAVTRINRDVLQRIEADRFDELPAPVYMKQFLKHYAEILNIDPGRVVADYLDAMTRKEPARS